jgi:3-oxoacyl-[acyl-carrier protein] reductase
LALARQGAKIVVNYRSDEARAKQLVEEIRGISGFAVGCQADVSDRIAVERMVGRSIDEFGHVDILVNNAGILEGEGSLLKFDERALDQMIGVNVKGILHCTRTLVPHMMERRYGKIVNIASVAGLGTSILPGNLLYASTKAAVVVLTKRLALELGKHGINVNAVAPGFIRTDMTMGRGSETEERERIRYYEERSMLGRIGEPEDIADTVLFLASDESRFITGQVITVDGGRTDFLSHSS